MSAWLLLVPGLALLLLLARELAGQYIDLWVDIQFGYALAFHAPTARRLNFWPHGLGCWW